MTEQEIIEPSTALVVAEIKNPSLVFVPKGLDPYIDRIKEAARKKAAELDISTPKNRAAIISLSVDVRTEKTKLEALRVNLVADEKRRLKQVDEEAKRAWDELEALQKEIRKPVSDWEDKEAARLKAHNDLIAEIEVLKSMPHDVSLEDIEYKFSAISDIYSKRNWEEFEVPAQRAISSLSQVLTETKARREKDISDAAELSRLRAIEEENNRKADEQYQEALIEDAAYNARVAAEKKAADDARIARELAEKATKDAADAAQKLLDDAEAERKRIEKKAADDKISAEKALADAETKRLADIADALQKQKDDAAAAQKVIDDAAAAQALIDKKRAEDLDHRKKINNEALSDIKKIMDIVDMTDRETAYKVLIVAIAKGEINHVKITY